MDSSAPDWTCLWIVFGFEFGGVSLFSVDIDYALTDMAPPFINEDECLVPGEPVVRVEKAPQNSRRIFAGIDIPASVDDVWELLTEYPKRLCRIWL